MYYSIIEIFLRISTKDPWCLISEWHAGYYLIAHSQLKPEKYLVLLEESLVATKQVPLLINYYY